MDYMNAQQKKIGEDMWHYTSAVAHSKNARKIEFNRKELLKTTLSAKNSIAKMSDFEGDASLRDSMVSYLNMSNSILNDDYSKIVDLEEIAEQSYDLMEAYMLAQEKANEKMELAGKMLENQTRLFAEKHKIKLIESEDKLSRKLELASSVFKYYNKIYLIFFKNYKQEYYFLNALEKQDINGLEQNKNTLVKYTKEGIKSLDTIKAYKNDPSLKSICRQLLDFYNQEAAIKAPFLIDFFLKKESYEKAKTAFESIKETDRTQQDVNQINKSVSDFNKTMTQYNAVIQDLQQRRTMLTDTWNKTTQSFFDRNIPKN
jgi:hypothetical protein